MHAFVLLRLFLSGGGARLSYSCFSLSSAALLVRMVLHAAARKLRCTLYKLGYTANTKPTGPQSRIFVSALLFQKAEKGLERVCFCFFASGFFDCKGSKKCPRSGCCLLRCASCPLPSACLLWTASLLPAYCSLSLAARYLLPAACSLPPAAVCLLPAACRLRTAVCRLDAMHRHSALFP
jgi:hypothetical protein